MADFRLSDDQMMLRDTVRRIATEKFAPRAAYVDEKEEFSWENFKVLSENGFLGVQIPEAYGGTEAGMLSMILTVEEVARCCAMQRSHRYMGGPIRCSALLLPISCLRKR